ncbi:MAG TPA: hypothetical protein VG796_23860 [Verrucomicrobiales bacterium]|nr:hypothetical protein [Verrucomicrobiales bacterium]
MSAVSEKSHKQLVSRILTTSIRRKLKKEQVDTLLGLKNDEFHNAFAAMINGFKTPERLKPIRPQGPLVLPAQFDIERGIFFGHQSGWTIWKGPAEGDGLAGEEEQDPRSLAVKEIDFSALTMHNFPTGLTEGEGEIDSEKRRLRLMPRAILAGARVFEALYSEAGQKTLRFLDRKLTIQQIDFLGTTLRSPDGIRFSLNCFRISGRSWNWGFRKLSAPRNYHAPALCFYPIRDAATW